MHGCKCKQEDSFFKVWTDIDDCPCFVRKNIEDPDDIDYIVLAPKNREVPLLFSEHCLSFGCCSVKEYLLKDGRKIIVGHHS